MTLDYFTCLVYVLAGAAIVCFFQERRKKVGRLDPGMLPELSPNDFNTLKILMKTAYERMLYLGVLFFPLAYAHYRKSDQVSILFFMLLMGLLFISNIPPRHKIMRLLEANNLSAKDLARRGIRL